MNSFNFILYSLHCNRTRGYNIYTFFSIVVFQAVCFVCVFFMRNRTRVARLSHIAQPRASHSVDMKHIWHICTLPLSTHLIAVCMLLAHQICMHASAVHLAQFNSSIQKHMCFEEEKKEVKQSTRESTGDTLYYLSYCHNFFLLVWREFHISKI